MKKSAAVAMMTPATTPPPKAKLLVDVPSAAEALSVGQRSVWLLIKDGQVVSVKMGRRRLITWASLQEYVAKLMNSDGDGDAS